MSNPTQTASNTPRKARVAILGGGGILGAHAPGYVRLADRCEIAAVAEKNGAQHERIRKLLQRDDVPIYTDYKDVLELPGLDAVDILLPHSMHMEAAVRAAEKGLHVLCEKVMARNTHECQAMVDACARAGVELVIMHDRRYHADWALLKGVIDSGEIGEVLFMKMEHNQNVAMGLDSWFYKKDGLGGGAIMSCLTHQIDALRWYLGEVESVQCMGKIVPSRMEGECIGVVTARMKSGALASLNINWHTRSCEWTGTWDPNSLWYEFNHVTGTKGEAYCMSGKGTFVKRDGETAFTKLEPPPGVVSGHSKCVEEFVNKVSGLPAEILTPGFDSLKTVEVAEAAYLAEAQERVVKLPIVPVPWEERGY